jgi:hypothetical protein
MDKKINIGEMIKVGWELSTKNFLYFLAIFTIIIGSNIVLSIGNEALVRNKTLVLAVIIYNLVVWVFGIVIGLGLIRICIDLVSGKKDPISTLFTVYRPTLKYIASSLLTSLITIVPLLAVLGAWIIGGMFLSKPGGLGSSFNVALGLLGIASLCYAVFMGTRLTFFSYFIIDKETGIIESIKASWKATEGNFWPLFLLQLILAGINVLGALALLFGLLITMPLSMLAMAAAYKKLTSDSTKEAIPSAAPAIEKLKASLAS